jgi:hypothetical protein
MVLMYFVARRYNPQYHIGQIRGKKSMPELECTAKSRSTRWEISRPSVLQMSFFSTTPRRAGQKIVVKRTRHNHNKNASRDRD